MCPQYPPPKQRTWPMQPVAISSLGRLRAFGGIPMPATSIRFGLLAKPYTMLQTYVYQSHPHCRACCADAVVAFSLTCMQVETAHRLRFQLEVAHQAGCVARRAWRIPALAPSP
eukprot:3647615-Alexandrium_andersonii.AAC.1